MSRCEHGEMISIYCLNDTCTWREAGGCQNCFKRYHNHPSNEGTVTQQKLDQLYRKMMIRPDPKPKSRILQEAVYNYFIIMKNLMSTSMDTVSRNITNRLNFPYLAEAGQLETFNKIKNKEYKKINKKQLKIFYDFANQNTKQQLQQKQKEIYADEVQNLKQNIKAINQAFVSYAQAIKAFDETFHVENTFVDKINEIASSIQALLKEGKLSTGPRSDASSKSKQHKIQQVKAEMHQLKRPPIPRDRDRKVSFDITSDVSALKVNLQTKHENEINQRKKKLLQMDNTSRLYEKDEIKINIIPTGGSNQQKKDKIIERSAEKHIPRQYSQDKISTKTQSYRRTSKQHSDSEIDPRLKIAHNALPRQVSKPKLYQHTGDVKEKKITIPVKIGEEKAECSSPLLKKKKTLNQNQNRGGFNLFKVESTRQEQNQLQASEITQAKSTPVTQQKQPQPSLLLKQKQADSLALLIKSLSVSAEQAIPYLQASLRYAHNNLSAAEYLSYLYLEIGKPKECLTVCNQFLEQVQDSPEAGDISEHLLNNKAAALNMLGRYSESISILEKCIEKKPKEIYYKNLADAYFSIGINEKAVLNYEKAIKLNSELDEALFNLAVCHYTQGHFKQAMQSAKKALELNQTNQNYQQLNKQLCLKLSI